MDRFGLKWPEYSWFDATNKNRILKEYMALFLHEKGKFVFYRYFCATLFLKANFNKV